LYFSFFLFHTHTFLFIFYLSSHLFLSFQSSQLLSFMHAHNLKFQINHARDETKLWE
jgi:hypothetical protein